MNKYLYTILITALMSCQDSTLYSGYIYDENQKVIPDVKIQIVGTDIVTYTDDNGFFSIDHKDRGQEILVLKSGYEMRFFTPKSDTEEIELVLKAEAGK